jgi:hypothetical protein
MSDEVLDAIDERVGERGRSRFLEEAAREKLRRLQLEESLRETKGIAKDYAHWSDRARAASWVREGRRSGRST